MPVISIESTVRLRYQEASIRAMNKTSRYMIVVFTRGNTSAMEDISQKMEKKEYKIIRRYSSRTKLYVNPSYQFEFPDST